MLVTRIRLQIDISGTLGNAAWETLRHFAEAAGGQFGPEEGTSGPCLHGEQEPHREGEWCGAIILLENHLLAEYALAHYLEQPQVLDACIEA